MRKECRRAAVAAVGLVAINASVAWSQTCVGGPSFSAGVVQVGGGATNGNHQKSTDLALAIGLPRSLFASGGMTKVRLSDIDRHADIYSVDAGYQIDLPAGVPLQLCPIVGYARQSGPTDVGSNHVHWNGQAAAAALSLGVVAYRSSALDLVPAVGFSIAESWLRGVNSSASYLITDDRQYARSHTLTLAPGLVFNRIVAVTPTVSFPISDKDAKTVFSLAASVSLFRR